MLNKASIYLFEYLYHIITNSVHMNGHLEGLRWEMISDFLYDFHVVRYDTMWC